MNPSKLKILTLQEAKALRRKWSKEALDVVFTNGCFDILHLGHVDYLEKAGLLGDRLIVALNSDDSVKRLKGEKRPLNDLWARSRLLASLQFVDMVVPFEEDTPLEIITALKPDILVKGKDYHQSNIVGSEYVLENGGRVETIELVENYSTTLLINKIKENL